MRGPTAFRRPRWQSHSDTAIGLRGPARRSGRHDTHPMQRRGAKSFVDDLVLSRGVVLSRAAASLRSIETKPFDWQICPPRTDTSPRKARTLSWVEVQGALSLSLVAGSLPQALSRTGSRALGLRAVPASLPASVGRGAVPSEIESFFISPKFHFRPVAFT